MKRLELGYDRLVSINPKLIYCAISGFGQSGPLAQNPAYDQIIQGLSGVMSITGSAESAPLRVGFPVSDTIGGLTAAFAIAGALVGRARSGKGRFIDVSMLDATLVSLGWVVSNYLTAGVTPSVMGNENMTAAPSGTFETANGLLNIAANKQEQFESLCKLLDRIDLITDPRFAEREARKCNRGELAAEIEGILRTRPASHWERALNEAGIPAGRVLSVPEALDSAQVRHRRLVQTIASGLGEGIPIRVVTAGFNFDGEEMVADGPPPTLGEHTDALLESLGYDEKDVARLRSEGII
jgi:crotonobetainyl-CoA:carnitine CoA-transferase CaiB-like acyl-CoA transferase